MNQWVLIGHRGVGKSSLLENLQENFPQFLCFSLDAEIEKREGRCIPDIFKDGEDVFREIEAKTFSALVEECGEKSFIIDLGAGFSGGIPENINVLWVKRKINSQKSQFLNRPNLDGHLQMSEERFNQREKRYQTLADITVELREGPRNFQKGEILFFKALLLGAKQDCLFRYFYTLTEKTTKFEKQLLLDLGLRGFEFREDLVSLQDLNPDKDLFSIRSKEKMFDDQSVIEAVKKKAKLWDFPLEMGVNEKAPIQSFHSKVESVEETFAKINQVAGVKKLALSIDSFAELIKGHQWMMEEPEKRVFLPMSHNGRWSWYRQLMAKTAAINFVRLSEGSAKDQPTVLEILNEPEGSKYFAAVLGSPVSHSYTPTFHQAFFAEKGASVFAIDLSEEEFEMGVGFLKDLGLRWAAVTAPLKMKAQQLVGADHPINTLAFNEKWLGANTDDYGFAKATEGIATENVVIWGGGGTHASLLKSFPKAQVYSSRTGELKIGSRYEDLEVVIWAVGAKNFSSQGVMPPSNWPIIKVIDLNYTQDSPGIICAHNYGCQYQSGLVMFEAQAEKQQEFFNECGI